MQNITIPALMMFAGFLAHGQTFDAASVKAAPPPTGNFIMITPPSGGPGTKDPGRIHYPNMAMKTLLMNAYDVKSFQIAGPDWLDSARYDIDATMPPETTREQFRAMLQHLLADRFKMTIHRETKELPMYSLTVTRGGLKIKEATDAPPKDEGDATPVQLPSQPKIGPDGFPLMPSFAGGRPGLYMTMMPGRARLTSQQQTMQDFATRLANVMGRPVADATGLKAKYDFTLTFSLEGLNTTGPMGPMPAPPPGGGANPSAVFVPDGEAPPDLFTAVQSQLGLKLDAKKGPVDMIVIDHIEKTPVEN